MLPAKIMRNWWVGWRHLYLHSAVYAQADSVAARARIELTVLYRLFGDAGFRSAGLALIAVQLLVMSLAWHWDLAGWRRDLLRSAPGLLTLPWLAAARYSAIRAILPPMNERNRD